MEVSAKAAANRATRVRWLFVASLLGALAGAAAGVVWRGWVLVPSDPGAGVAFILKSAAFHACGTLGIWQLYPTATPVAWWQLVVARVGNYGLQQLADAFTAIKLCSAGGALAGACALAAVAGRPNH